MPRYEVSFSYREDISKAIYANSFAEVERELSKNHENVKIQHIILNEEED